MYYVCLMPDIRVRTSAVVQEIVSCQKGSDKDMTKLSRLRLVFLRKLQRHFKSRGQDRQPGMDCQDI